MQTLLYIIAALIIIALLVAIVWRLASRRQSLPCPVWLRWLVEIDNPFTKTNRAAEIISRLDIQPDMNVADFGCGPGRLTIPLAQRLSPQGSVLALDIQPGMIQRARQKAQDAQLHNITFLNAPLGDGHLPSNHFDRALLVTVLGEIPDRTAAFKEIFHALKPQGILSVTEIIFDPHFQPRRTVTRLAQDVGLQEKAFFGRPWAYTIHFVKPAQ